MALLLVLGSSVASATTLKYHIIDLESYTLNPVRSSVVGMNDQGDVIGYITTQVGSSTVTKPYVWTKRVSFSDPPVRCMVLNPVQGDTSASVSVISSQGAILGNSGDTGAKWTLDSSTGTAIVGSGSDFAVSGINDSGTIVAKWNSEWSRAEPNGQSYSATALAGDPDKSQPQDVSGTDINSSGTVVGWTHYLENAAGIDLPMWWTSPITPQDVDVMAYDGVSGGKFKAINDVGIAVGLLLNGNTYSSDGFACDLTSLQLYRWKTTQLVFNPSDINDSGLMVGSSNSGLATMLYTSTASRYYLHDSGHFESSVFWSSFGNGSSASINNFGMICGSGNKDPYSTQTSAFLAVPYYEPHATLSIPVTLMDATGTTFPPVSWEVRQGNVTILTGTKSLNSQGRLVLDSTQGNCPVRGDVVLVLNGTHWLSKKVAFTIAVDATSWSTNDPVELINGDVDGDNAVTVFDYTMLSDAFDSTPEDANWNENADLDCDGEVTVFDYTILSENFDVTGDF